MAGNNEKETHDTSEKPLKRNPHPDFGKVQDSRPDYGSIPPGEWTWSKTRDPEWKPGQGGNDGGESLKHKHIEIDPYEEGRPPGANYKLLISGIVPRFIGFLSTRSADGSSTNLAPFSYTTVINHDPPLFCVGFAGSLDRAKDTLRNLLESRECVLNVVSEHFSEAANATAINAPYGASEWSVSGLHPGRCKTVRASRVLESVFSVEARLVETREFESRATPGKKTGVLAIIEGTRFWVREDAIDDDRTLVDPAVLRPVSRFGGITYGVTHQGFELLRHDFEDEKNKGLLDGLIQEKSEGQ